MDKVNEFEFGLGSNAKSSLFPFSVQSNIHYRVDSLDDLTANGYKVLLDILRHLDRKSTR